MVVMFDNLTKTIIQIVDVLATITKLSFEVTRSVTFWCAFLTSRTVYARTMLQDYERHGLSLCKLYSMTVEWIAAAIRK
jgi:hypothetical protein